jgi:hypothetical protein
MIEDFLFTGINRIDRDLRKYPFHPLHPCKTFFIVVKLPF